MKSETLSQKAKNQIIKGFLYWLWRYISIFITSILAIVLITITIGIPLYMIFGGFDKWLSILIGVACGSMVSINIMNINRYQNCWLSIKINFYRYKVIKTIEKCPIERWREIQIKGYIESQLKNLMEDFRE